MLKKATQQDYDRIWIMTIPQLDESITALVLKQLEYGLC